MSPKEALPAQVQQVLRQGLLRGLPITFQPFVSQQIGDWDYLFPFEQQYLLRILTYLGSLDEERFAGLFRSMREIEARMEVSRWPFSTHEQTIENASLLARSPYYRQWRQEVQKVFDQIDRQATATENYAGGRPGNRLILLIFPQRLPLEAAGAWKRWQGMGRELKLDLGGEKRSLMEILFKGFNRASIGTAPGFLEALARKDGHSASDLWVLDAGAGGGEPWPALGSSDAELPGGTFLSYDRLKTFRESFSQQINMIRKDLADADAVYARLRSLDVTGWCPPEVASRPTVKKFVTTLFLSGNGALVFGNAFVEWAAAEALRRARPSVLVAQFGLRYKPKLFTSVVVFENQEKASPLPQVEDPPGSAADAQILAHYVWLAASRYPEYQRALCLCVAENLAQAYAVGPSDCPLSKDTGPIPLSQLPGLLSAWLS